MKTTIEDLYERYNILKRKASVALQRKEYRYSLDCLNALAYIAYHYGLCFEDEEVESLLRKISKNLIKNKIEISQQSLNSRCVFVDSLCGYHGGLTVQYLRAIKHAGWDVLYIADNRLYEKKRESLRDELKLNERLNLICVPQKLKGIARCQFIYDAIIGFNPNWAFMHITPFGACPATVFYALPKGIKRFWINFADHSFHLGTGCVDRSFEFRSLGASISSKYRHIEVSKIFMLPFYSFTDDYTFQGLPEICNNKTIIFSGGNFWKIIDEDDSFFRLVKRILDKCPNVVVVYAGDGVFECVNKSIRKYELGERFVLLGWRKDISALFEKCDIYLNTYPIGGGLMCQFAARAGKPILSYDPEKTFKAESLTCQVKQVRISVPDLDSLVDEACHLVEDEDYRIARGKEIRDSTLSVEDFNEMFKNAVEGDIPTRIPLLIDNSIGLSENNIRNNLKVYSKDHEMEAQIFDLMGMNMVRAFPLTIAFLGFRMRFQSYFRKIRRRIFK